MKKIIKIILFSFLLFSLTACNNENNKIIENKEIPNSPNKNIISQNNNQELNMENYNENNTNNKINFNNILNDIKYNQNLTDYEKQWLSYLEIKYPNSKIFHMKTKIYQCDGCYLLSYKKDREVIKIKILNYEKQQENKVVDDIVTEIDNSDICLLFQGTWNECPKLCDTDETACKNECGLPVCEFDKNKIILKEKGEICGNIDEGDCKYGLTCYYNSKEDLHGICK